jgi:hypothetical protein
MTDTTIELRLPLAARRELEQRAKLLAYLSNDWHLVEFGIALAAGIAASSVALTSFASDSLIEVLAASVIVWLFSAGRGASENAKRSAQQLLAAGYFLLVAYIVSHAVYDLIVGARPGASWAGSDSPRSPHRRCRCSRAPMRKVGHALNSSATVSEAGQKQSCAYLSIALLAVSLSMLFPAARPPRSSSPPSRSTRGARAGAAQPASAVLTAAPPGAQPAAPLRCRLNQTNRPGPALARIHGGDRSHP